MEYDKKHFDIVNSDLWMLPSGATIRPACILATQFDAPAVDTGASISVVFAVEGEDRRMPYEATYYDDDAMALQAALRHLAAEVEAPTMKGDDADGDGRTGE